MVAHVEINIPNLDLKTIEKISFHTIQNVHGQPFEINASQIASMLPAGATAPILTKSGDTASLSVGDGLKLSKMNPDQKHLYKNMPFRFSFMTNDNIWHKDTDSENIYTNTL